MRDKLIHHYFGVDLETVENRGQKLKSLDFLGGERPLTSKEVSGLI